MTLSEPKDAILRRLAAYRDRQLIVRSGKRYLAHIDTLDLDDQGVGLTGTLLHAIDPESIHRPVRPLPRGFKWRATWDLIGGGQGLLIAYYVSWSIFYDEELNESVADAYTRLGSTADFSHEAIDLIETWQAAYPPEPLTPDS